MPTRAIQEIYCPHAARAIGLMPLFCAIVCTLALLLCVAAHDNVLLIAVVQKPG